MLHARTFRWLANAAAFLYAGRLIAEWLHPPTAAVLLIIVAALGAATAAKLWWKRSPPWAALLLWLYVLYPQADVRAALLVGLAALLAGLLFRRSFPAWRWPALVAVRAGARALFADAGPRRAAGG
jgi:hypothetical protein